MAAPTDSTYVDPTAATTGLDQQDAFNTVLDQLADPAGILANALMRIHQADAVILAPLEDDEEDRDLVEIQALYRLGSAFVLRGIAEAAMALQMTERAAYPVAPVESGPAPVVNEPRYKPQATNGLRFTVRYPGRDLGDAVWVPVLAAFVDKRGFYRDGPADVDRDAGCDVVLRAAGRIVSATPSAVMAITDDGEVLCLRRGVGEYAESPDE